MRIAMLLFLGAMLLATGCASAGGRARDGGVVPAARIGGVDTRGDSIRVTVTLAERASVVVLHVVPGRGVVVLDASDTMRDAGAHRLAMVRPERAVDDRPRGVRARDTQRMSDRGGVLAPARVPVRDPLLREPAHLLVLSTGAALDPRAVHAALDGVTLPAHPDEALRAAGLIVRRLAGGASWSGARVRVE